MVRFASLLPEPAQQQWLHTGHVEETHERVSHSDDLRPSQWERFARLADTPEADAIFALLRRYVSIAIPDPARYEPTFWTCTAFPSASLAGDRDYVRLNINWQETLCVFSEGNRLVFTTYLARSPLTERFGETCERVADTFAGLQATATGLVPGGTDQFRLQTHDAHALLAAMDDEDVGYATRLLALRLLNRGACPWQKSHNWFLADQIFAA